VLELAAGLPTRSLHALANLERRTIEADGGRLKLEWGVLGSRGGGAVEDLLWWDGGELRGFLGLYAFGAPKVELAGMVDPVARRHGIATALLDAALPLLRDRGFTAALLVTPRTSTGGRAFAEGRGAVLEHSEHALVLVDEPTAGASDPQVTTRTAVIADAPDVARLLDAAFGAPPSDVLQLLTTPGERTVLIERGGAAIGTVRLTREGDTAGIYGFAIDPAWQGRGIGRDVLRRVCQGLRAEGAQRVGLEVAVDNERALGLYTSVGFGQVATEDYYALPSTSWTPGRLDMTVGDALPG
jgi:ribosomal protein S18 acetylase RimI-like enzyme